MFSRIHHTGSNVFTLIILASFVLLVGFSGQSTLAPENGIGAVEITAEKPDGNVGRVSYEDPKDEDMGQEDVSSDQISKLVLGSNAPSVSGQDEVEDTDSNSAEEDYRE